MDFETSDMELEIKDEVKEEFIDEILKEAQEALEIANSELKTEDGIDTEDLFCPRPPPTFDVELNAVETDFDGSPEEGPSNSISKARVTCSLCPKSFPTSKALQEHTLNLHTSEHDDLVEFPCIICVDCNFIDQKSLEKHVKQYHITNVSVLLSRDPSLLKCSHCPRLFLVQKDLNAHVESEHTDPLEIDPLSTITPPVGTETTLKISTTRHKHKCPHCPFTFLLSQSLQEHIIKIHVKHKAFPCHICANLKRSKVQSFIDQQSLDEHIKSCHAHVREGEPDERVKCPHCPSTFSRDFNLRQHIIKCHVKHKAFPCNPCASLKKPQVKSFISQKNLELHLQRCHSHVPEEKPAESRLKCPQCEKTYSQKSHLADHITDIHNDPGLWVQCSQCPLFFPCNQALKSHLISRHKETCENNEGQIEPSLESQEKCPHCDITLSGKTSLAVHIELVHSESHRQPCIKCPHCPDVFLLNQNLQEHINKLRVNNKVFPCPCHICANLNKSESKFERFINKQSLSQHIKTCHGHIRKGETAESRLKCPHCDKTYSRKGHLTYHIKDIHSGPRLRVQCPQCPLSFSRRQRLKSHLISCHQKPCENNDGEMEPNCTTVHIKRSTAKRLPCLHCPLTLSSSSALKKHVMRVHERHKALPCLTCKSRKTSKVPVFATQEQLAQHMRLYHDPASLQKCPHCDKSFPRRNLKYHILTTHLNIPRLDLKNHLRGTKYTLDNLLKEQIQEKEKKLDSIVTKKRRSKPQIRGTNNCRYCNKIFLNTREFRDHIIEIHVKQKKTAEKEDLQNHAKEPKGNSGKESEPENSTKNQCQPLPRVQCPKCPSTFSNSKHLQFHIMLLHVEKEEFPCLICTSRDQGSSSNPESGTEMKIQNFIFKDEISLNQHMKNIHYTTHKQNTNLEKSPEKVRIVIPKNKICPICSKSFSGKWAASNYRGHMQTHLDIKRYSCEHCFKKFTTKISLHMHLIRYHKYTREQLNLKYTCQLCPFITLTGSLLSYHMSRKHPYAQLQLDDQMNTDPQIEPSLSHGNSRSKSSSTNPPQSAACFVCSKSQTSESNLVQHLKEHRGEGRFFCDLCPRDYHMRMRLLTHLKLDHHKLAYCNNCFTSFTDAAACNQHILHIDAAALNLNPSENGNSRASNLRCEICDTIFKSPCLFKIHTISHLKEIQKQELNFPDDEVVSADKIFKCSVCPKVFDRQSYLNAHLEIVHKSPQECSCFPCTKCERNYKFISELKHHYLLTHSPKINQQVNQNHSAAADGDFGFECDICLTKFGAESELTDHQDNFRSEVLCHICASKFKGNTALVLHLKRVHKTDNYSHEHLCHICPSTFFDGKELRRHVERVHEGKFKIQRRYERAEKIIENQSETFHECNDSNNKVSDVLLGEYLELEPNPTATDSRGRSKNEYKSTSKSAMCFVCSKMQSTKFNLTKHLKEHRGEQRAYCDLCPRDFYSRFYLMDHLKLDHHKLAYCNKCFTSFVDKEALNQHLHVDVPTLNSNQPIKSQASENADPPASNLKCEMCSESSKSPCLFKIHTISHLREIQQQELIFPDDQVVSAENIFKCSVCPSAFDRQSYLNAHLNIVHESSSFQFQCGKCERTYKSQNELKSHDLVVHSPKINQHINQNHASKVSDAELAFECSTCSSKFLTQSQLTNHQDIFESMLPCHICSTKFKSLLNLKTHIRRVHGSKRSKNLVCGFCLFKFSGMYDLQRHVQRVHEGKNTKTN